MQVEKNASDKIDHVFMIKALSNIIEGNFPSQKKGLCEKPVTVITSY